MSQQIATLEVHVLALGTVLPALSCGCQDCRNPKVTAATGKDESDDHDYDNEESDFESYKSKDSGY
jgi:hypothetical protein